MSAEGDSDRLNQAVPGSNPGSDDPSGGMGVGSGGVSSAAYVHSPVPSEQRSVMQSTVDTATAAVETVKSYLPSLASLSLGGGKTEEQEARSTAGAQEAAVAGGAATVAAASTAAAAATTDKDAAPTDSADHPASTTAKDVAMADSTAKDGDTVTDTANQKARVMDEGKSSDIATSDRGQEERTAKTDTEAAEPGAGNEGSEINRGSEQTETESSDQPKKKETGGSSMENKDAIPTAGGEKLGEKHWGESKMVPDLPPKRDSDAGAQVSSSEGQPDKATQDNTAQNTGGAAPPSGDSADGSDGKMSLKDKVKDKLNIGSKKD